MKHSRVVVTGSLAFDHIMSVPGHFKDHIMPDKIHAINVSFIMDSFRNEFGGTGGNMAYSLSNLGIPTLLVGSAGNDFSKYKAHLLAQPNLDLSGVSEFPDTPSAQGFVMTDRDDNQVWGFFEGAMKQEVHVMIKNMLKKDDFLIVGPTNPVAMMQFVRDAVETKTPYMFDPAFNIPLFEDDDMTFAVENATIVIGNDYEMEMIRRKVRMNDEAFFPLNRIVVTTMGASGSEIVLGNQITKVEVAKINGVVDPTGAGDAYRAGFVAGYIKEKDLEICARIASVSAGYAVENYGTQNQKYTLTEFADRYKASYGETLEL